MTFSSLHLKEICEDFFHLIFGFITDDVQAYLFLEVGLWRESWCVFRFLKEAYCTDMFFHRTQFKINGLLGAKTEAE